MLARTIAFLPCALALHIVTAQDAPQRVIEVHVEGLSNDTVYLANYYGNKLFYADTAVANTKGLARFNDPKGYKAGVYAVVIPGPKYFEIVVNEPRIVLHTTADDLMGDLVVKESVENNVFLAYIRFLADRKMEGDALREGMQGTDDPIAKAGLKADMEALDRTVKAYQRKLIADNSGTLAAGLVHMSMTPELPEIRKADGTLDSLAAYHQFREHYWDHFDLSDERIVRVPIFANKLEEYMTRMVPQVPDTINRLADALIARTEASEEVFKYVVHSYTHKYETSDIMGMDAVFVHLAQTYYCPAPGKASRATWMSDEKLEKLCERARKMAPLTLGKPAKDIILTDSTEQRWIGFHSLPAEYVVIVFWDPNCGVCKKELPALYEVYKDTLKAMGVEVFAVAKAVDDVLLRDWKKFIREQELDWVNVALTKTVYEEARKDPMKYIPKLTTLESLNYADTYDVFSTPKIFLVDGDRKFVGKQLAPEQIEDLVRRLKERKAKG